MGHNHGCMTEIEALKEMGFEEATEDEILAATHCDTPITPLLLKRGAGIELIAELDAGLSRKTDQ